MAVLGLALLGGTALAGCAVPGGELVLTLGVMMPLTGALSNLGPTMEEGARLAVEEVNAANAGLRIQAHYEDDKTTDTAAITNTFNRLAGLGITAAVGPCCSGVTASILDLAVQNQIVVSTPSATSPALTLERDNQGYFWRVVSSDAVQGKVLAKLVDSENVSSVNMIIVNNAYGNGLTGVFETYFESELGGAVGKVEKYDEGATVFSSQVDSACGAPKPPAIVFVAYTDDAAAILKEMQAKGCLENLRLFSSEGIYSPDGAVVIKAGKDPEGNFLAAGMKGTNPDSGNLSAFESRFMQRYNHAAQLYSAESYDAVMYVALAALKADSTSGRDISANLLAIANPPGTKVSSFADAGAMIEAGEDIDWVGQAHDFEFDERHEPVTGLYSYWEVQDDGEMNTFARGQTV